MTLLEVKFFRAFRELKNGGLVSSGLRIGVTHTGILLVPAREVGISDAQALRFAGNPDSPVLIEGDTVFIDIQHAIDFHPEPANKACLERIRANTLKRLGR